MYMELQDTLKTFMAEGLQLNKIRHYRWISAILDRLHMPLATNIKAVRRRLEQDSYDVTRLEERLEVKRLKVVHSMSRRYLELKSFG